MQCMGIFVCQILMDHDSFGLAPVCAQRLT
jgi:hypothetical protein